MNEIVSTHRAMAQWSRWLVFVAVPNRRSGTGQLRDTYRTLRRNQSQPVFERPGKPRTHRLGMVYAPTYRDALQLASRMIRKLGQGTKLSRLIHLPLSHREYEMWLRDVSARSDRAEEFRPICGPCVDAQGHPLESFVPNG